MIGLRAISSFENLSVSEKGLGIFDTYKGGDREKASFFVSCDIL
jgi:hypothetical protein